MALTKLIRSPVTAPSAGVIGTSTRYTSFIQDMAKYLKNYPADYEAWDTAIQKLKIYTPNSQHYPFMAPLIRELGKILPYTAHQNEKFATSKALELLHIAEQFDNPSAESLVEEIANRIAYISNLHAQRKEAFDAFKSCKFPALDAPMKLPLNLEVEPYANNLDINLERLVGYRLPQIYPDEFLKGKAIIHLLLKIGDAKEANYVLQHLNHAVFCQDAKEVASGSKRFSYSSSNSRPIRSEDNYENIAKEEWSRISRSILDTGDYSYCNLQTLVWTRMDGYLSPN